METNYWKRITDRRLTRRRMLLVSSQASVAGLLYACGGGGDDDDDGGNGGATGTTETRPTSTPLPTVVPSELTGAKYGGTIRIGYSGASLTNLDPHSGASGAEHQFFFPVMDPLVGYDRNGRLDPNLSLAESWELVGDTQVTMKLRSGIKFQDGTDFNAESVKWNIQRILDPAKPLTPRVELGAIDTVDAVSATEVVLKLKQPSAPLLTNLGDRGGQMISRAALEKLGDDAFRRTPVGTGPFTLKSWVDDANLTFEANPNYWRKDEIGQKLPYLQTIQVELMPDTTVRTAAFDAGGIDVLIGPAATDVQRLIGDSNVQISEFVGSSTAHWYMNHSFGPLANLWFRRAVSSALDRENYIKNFLVGDEPITTGYLTPATWAHDPAIVNYNFDIAKAKEYLQQSGLPESEWKIRSQPFGATITDAELFWEESLKEAGITIEWAQPERDGWQAHVLKGLGGDGSAGMYYSGFSLRVDPDGHMSPLFSEKGAYNSGQVPCPEVEPLLAQARTKYDQAERKALYSEAQKAAVEQQYSCFTVHYGVTRTFARKPVGNFAAFYGGEGKPRFANLWV